MGDVLPVTASVELGPLRLSVPLGAYAEVDGRLRFVPSLDVVGLSAALAGILVGWRLGLAVVRAVSDRRR